MNIPKIAFVGAGNMASALIGGMLADGTPADSISASDPDQDKLSALAQRLGIQILDSNQQAAQADVLVLAVKPQALRRVAEELSETVQLNRPLVLSIAAGVRSSTLNEWLGGQVALVRSMPNTPAMVQSGATALFATPQVNATQREMAETILRSVGLTCWLQDEAQMDAVTALSGSGPAYFFLVMEAMEEAAIQLGLEGETARLLTLQTALGAARMALESDAAPAQLRQNVTSPGGTTEQALRSFEQDGLRACFARALTAAQQRSAELATQLAQPESKD